MDPKAEGVIFREYTYTDHAGKRKKATFINNYFPPSNPQTAEQQANRMRFATLSNIAIRHTSDIIRNIWQPLAEKRQKKGAHGCNEFRGTNMRRIGTPPLWAKMLVSDGNLEPTPKVLKIEYDQDEPVICMQFDHTTKRNGSPEDRVYPAVLYKPTMTLLVLERTGDWKRKDEWVIAFIPDVFPLTDLIGYVWFRRQTMYSPSESIEVIQ